MTYQHRSHVFISYVREDIRAVERIVTAFRERAVDVWLDRNELHPGMRWKDAIREAIKQGNYFVACFSENYYRRPKTYMNEELALAVEELRKYSINRRWFIPVLLSECEVPDIPIGGGQSLRDLQWVELYRDWDFEAFNLVNTVEGASARSLVPQSRPMPSAESFSGAFAAAVDDALSTPGAMAGENKGERVAQFIETAAECLHQAVVAYTSTGKVPHIRCGEIKTLLWAVNRVIDTTDEHWLQDTVHRAHRILWKYVGGWVGIAERSDGETLSIDALEDLTGQLRGTAKWVRSNL